MSTAFGALHHFSRICLLQKYKWLNRLVRL